MDSYYGKFSFSDLYNPCYGCEDFDGEFCESGGACAADERYGVYDFEYEETQNKAQQAPEARQA